MYFIKLSQILNWDSQNKLLDFGGIDLIFMVTRILQKGLSVLYHFNQWPAFDQTDTYTAGKTLMNDQI